MTSRLADVLAQARALPLEQRASLASLLQAEVTAAHLAAITSHASETTAGHHRALDAVAASLGWTPRHLRAFCARHDIAIGGTRKAQLVDPLAVQRAVAESSRVRRPHQHETKPANDGSPAHDRDAELFDRTGYRLAPAHDRGSR